MVLDIKEIRYVIRFSIYKEGIQFIIVLLDANIVIVMFIRLDRLS